MRTDEIYTHTDWLVAVTEAFKEGDEMALFELRAKAESWLQPANETEAQTALVDTLLESVYNYN